jgi:hypothetical protein
VEEHSNCKYDEGRALYYLIVEELLDVNLDVVRKRKVSIYSLSCDWSGSTHIWISMQNQTALQEE